METNELRRERSEHNKQFIFYLFHLNHVYKSDSI